MGLTILPPDINASDWAYAGAGRAIRVGLMQVKTLKRALADQIMAERAHAGPFRSFHDFWIRVGPEPAQARALIRAGCCDSIAGELTRPALLWRVHAGMSAAGALPIPNEHSASRKLHDEIETVGFPLSRHPLELYGSQIAKAMSRAPRPYITASQMGEYVGRQVTMVGWLVTEKLVQTKGGEPMEFVTFEDDTALYDATLFPATYRRVCHLLTENKAYLLTGLIEEDFGAVAFTVKDLRCLSRDDFGSSERTTQEPQRGYVFDA